ncbi:hypothetical protein E2320_014165 [Naja naja]|nr:hypothetical protein E2320_014165 [Naja naja]
MALAEDAIEIPALGHPFQLGMLYDCRKDALIPGVTLWDCSSLQKDLTTKPQPTTATKIIASDSIDDKASALDISGSLKASFFGGLINVRGSAEYLQDTKKSKKQARVTIQYKTTTRNEQLTMSHLGIQNVSHPAVFEQGTATHVVTAILYGAQAFLSLTERGEAEVKLTEEEKENALKFRCKFYGDFSLERNPVTFQDAIKVHATLPKLLGEDGEKAVPMWVWLYPLTKLDTRAAKMVCEISLGLIFDAEKILEELNEIQMQSNDLANDPIAETFPEIKRKIQQFKDLLKQHRQTFQKQLARVLPSIRGGGQEEGTLVDILMSINHQAAKSLKDFVSINQSNPICFVVASLPDVDIPGASIYLYEDGDLVSKDFELPSKPLPFLISEVTHNRIHLKFQPAEYGKATISNYLVKYKVAGEENWKTVRTEDAREIFLLKDLPPNTEYQFQYAACCKLGRSKSSELSPPIKTLPISPPEKLSMVTASSSIISVAWMSPSIVASGVVVKEYKVEYRTVEAGTGKDQIQVSTVCDNGALSVPSKEVAISTTLEKENADNVAHQFLQKSSLVEDRQPLVFALPLEKVPSDASTSCLMYQLGEKNLEVPNKVILVMGATGCGKTTLISGMINYILGVQWEDNFRFKLIHETTQRREAGSSTSEVRAYVVNHQKGFRIPYSFTIIDTPGFGGTRDAEQDKLVGEQLLEFFSTPGGIDHMDAICLVAQAFLAPSTHAQKCIFDSMLSMLGKDLEDNIQLLTTFAEGETPPVLEALKEADLPCAQDKSPQHFRFNHSALFAPRENGGSPNAAAEMFWKMSTESMKDFFDSLRMLETKSLTLTLEVLKERQELEAALTSPPPPKKSRVSCGATGLDIAGSIPEPERRIVLVGTTRSGKSATGNTVLGSKVFQSGGPFRSTTACQKEEAQLKGRKVVVVDTPGFFHYCRPEMEVAAQVSKGVKFCCPGPHVILHVMYPLGSSQEEMKVAQQIEEMFGLKAKDYTIILFTFKDELEGPSIENLISSRNAKVKKYIAECGYRYLFFNNKAEGGEREAQVTELMIMIDALVETNRNSPCYTEDMMNFNKRHNF